MLQLRIKDPMLNLSQSRMLLILMDGTPRVRWTKEEVDRMNIIEDLTYAVVGKFSYGLPDLRIQIPK